MNALTPVDQGFIQVADVQVTSKDLDMVALCHRVGMVFQQYNLFPHKTVLQNLTMAPIQVLKQPRAEVTERARALLDKVRLGNKADAYPGELSGGQQQRVAIARALCMQPEVILFDEVTAALDPEMVGEVLNVIREIARDGMTCMIVTHEMAFAREAANHMYFTDGGVIVEFGAPDAFFSNPKDERTKTFSQRCSNDIDASGIHIDRFPNDVVKCIRTPHVACYAAVQDRDHYDGRNDRQDL